MTVENDKYIAGVDVAKIIAMVFVVALHVASQGLIIGGTDPNGCGMTLRMLRETFLAVFVTCIDIFAIISGYVGVRSRFNVSRLISLWLQVLFTCVVVTAGYAFFANARVRGEAWIRCFLPIAGAQYWYMTAYFMLALTMPFLNAGINVMERKQVEFITAFLVSSVCGLSIFGIKGGFGVSAGFSYAWLLILYLLGACWRIYYSNRRIRWFWWLLPVIPLAFMGGAMPLFLPHCVASRVYWGGFISPFVVLEAICLVGFSLSLQIDSERIKRSVKWIAGCALGVYLAHLPLVFWDEFLTKWLATFHAGSVGAWMIGLSALTCLIVLYGIAFEILRQGLFRVLHVNSFCRALERMLVRRWGGL